MTTKDLTPEDFGLGPFVPSEPNADDFDLSDPESRRKYWNLFAESHLVGKTVKKVRYMNPKEAKQWGWYSLPLILEFTDGSWILASSDDEGNDGGALFGQTTKGKDLTFPVLSD